MSAKPCDSIESLHLGGGSEGRDLCPALLPVAEEPLPTRGMIIGIAVAVLMVIGLLVALVVVLKDPSHVHHIQRCY